MTKLKAIDRLNRRIPPMKPKAENIANGISNSVKKIRKKSGGGHHLSLNVLHKLIYLYKVILKPQQQQKKQKAKELIQKHVWETF